MQKNPVQKTVQVKLTPREMRIAKALFNVPKGKFGIAS